MEGLKNLIKAQLNHCIGSRVEVTRETERELRWWPSSPGLERMAACIRCLASDEVDSVVGGTSRGHLVAVVLVAVVWGPG
jgi:hypothetical protein